MRTNQNDAAVRQKLIRDGHLKPAPQAKPEPLPEDLARARAIATAILERARTRNPLR